MIRYAATVVYVEDVPGTVDFYRRAFGLAVRFSDDRLGFTEFDTGTATLAIAAHSLGEMLMPGAYAHALERRHSGVEIGFLTDDVPAAFDKAVAAGAAPIAAPKRMPWGLQVAYVRAPEGTMIGLSEPPPVEAAEG